MATAASTVSPIGLQRFRRWYQQYRATHGTPPPKHLVSGFLQAEMESQMARAEQGRLLSLKEKAFEKESSLAEERLGLARRRLGMDEERMRREAGAAEMSGIGTLALGGTLLGKEMGLGAPIKKAATAIGEKIGIGGGAPAVSGVGIAGALEPVIGTAASLPVYGSMYGGGAVGTIASGAGAGLPATMGTPLGAEVIGGPLASAGTSAAVPTAGAGAGGGLSFGTLAPGAAAGALGGMIGRKIFTGEPRIGGAATGVAAGAGVGFAVGGPIGAVVGGIVGIITGGK